MNLENKKFYLLLTFSLLILTIANLLSGKIFYAVIVFIVTLIAAWMAAHKSSH